MNVMLFMAYWTAVFKFRKFSIPLNRYAKDMQGVTP
jgi:hypothetical protein